LLALLVAIGCAGGAGEAVEPRPTASATCGDFVARYREVLASGARTCRSDTDCAVYGGLDPENVCGGATDAETARALTQIGDESDAAGCPRPGYSCSPIALRCLDGFCH